MSNENTLTTTLQALIDEECQRTANAASRFGTFATLVQDGVGLLNTCVKSADDNQFMAVALMLAVQKSVCLAFLSYIRGHIAQAEFNVRQSVEFTALMAYMLAHPEEDVTSATATVSFQPAKVISGRAYKWLATEHSHISKLLKDIKDQINDTTAHASPYLTHFTFDWESGSESAKSFRGSFFDNVEDNVFRLYLMSLGRLIVIIIETLRQVSEKYGGFHLRENITSDLHHLDRTVIAHRDSLASRMGMNAGAIR